MRVGHLWEANGTAYRVMPHYPARRLLEVRQGMNEPPDEEAVRALLDALLGALGAFHQAGGGHGKVTPSNILLLADNRFPELGDVLFTVVSAVVVLALGWMIFSRYEPRLAEDEDYVPLAKHSSVPVGGNMHGHER